MVASKRLCTDPTLSHTSILYGCLVQYSIFNIGLRLNMDITPAPVSHTILGYRASGTSRRQLFSPEYSHRSPGSYECTHLGLGRLSDTARAPDPRLEIIYTSPQSDFLSSGYEIITTCGGKSSKGLYERLACPPILPYRGVIDATAVRRLSGVRDTT